MPGVSLGRPQGRFLGSDVHEKDFTWIRLNRYVELRRLFSSGGNSFEGGGGGMGSPCRADKSKNTTLKLTFKTNRPQEDSGSAT